MLNFLKFSSLFYVFPTFAFFQLLTFANVLSVEFFQDYVVCTTYFAFLHIVSNNLPEKIALKELADQNNNYEVFLEKLEQQCCMVGMFCCAVLGLFLGIFLKINIYLLMYSALISLSTSLVGFSLSKGRLDNKYRRCIIDVFALFFPAMILCTLAYFGYLSASNFLKISVLILLLFSIYFVSTRFKSFAHFRKLEKISFYNKKESLIITSTVLMGWITMILILYLNQKFLDPLEFKDFSVAQRFAAIIGLGLSVFVAFFQKNTISNYDTAFTQRLMCVFLISTLFLSAMVFWFYNFSYVAFNVEPLMLCFVLLAINVGVGSFTGYFINPLFLRNFDYKFYTILILTLSIPLFLMGNIIILKYGATGSALLLVGYQLTLMTVLLIRMRTHREN